MKRNRKLIRNSVLIAIFLFFIYYFGGYYLSKEQCILETMRGLYANESEKILELENGNRSFTLMADEDEKTYSLIGTRKIGFLYRTASSSVGITIREENKIHISGLYNSDSGMVITVYRNDPSICKIEAALESGETVTFDEWIGNFSGLVLDTGDFYNGIYKAYDTDNQLIEEVSY